VQGTIEAEFLDIARSEAATDEAEEHADGVVEEEAVTRFVGGQRGHFQLAQGIEAVAAAIGIVVHRQVAELLGPGFEVEEEQKAVEVAQSLLAELAGQVGIALVDLVVPFFHQITDGLVANQLNGLACGIFEILGNGEGVPVGVLVERIEQRGAGFGADMLAVQQRGHGLEGGGLAAFEDLTQIEAQQPLLAPFAAVHQHQRIEVADQQPARRFGQGEDLAGDDGFDIGAGKQQFGVGLGRVLRWDEGVIQRVGYILRLAGGHQDPEPGRAIGPADFPRHGAEPVLGFPQRVVAAIPQHPQQFL